MNKILWSVFSTSIITQAFALGNPIPAPDTNNNLLPSPFSVYVIQNSGVVNHPVPGAVEVLLPTDNSYTGSPGCYVACYSHKNGVYSVAPDISVMGQVRVKGQYVARICQPEGYQGKDISTAPMFKMLCSKGIPSCADGNCWGGGDTGGWFGIQP
ncbi:hypothetical protein [Legionella fallonii]|uniref:Secreted protein n=1 Tax=Legionella fallonii LLAP-10 TaxID=1212491 RepID=A0A098G8C2_9GAMM|nr:hypothetical protein [Legionella fallonii]CEG57720.1 conserved exported protein of unknown function [Legionella fallonii LLAP-10]